MRRLKIYLDTSTISHLEQHDAPEKVADTRLFWENLKVGEHDIYISNIAIGEVIGCSEPKRSLLHAWLESISYTLLDFDGDEEVKALAEQIIESKILTRKSYDDCLHIAGAVVYGCDVIVSWNFRHMVNYKTINGVKVLSYSNGYKLIEIFTPTIMLGGTENE